MENGKKHEVVWVQQRGEKKLEEVRIARTHVKPRTQWGPRGFVLLYLVQLFLAFFFFSIGEIATFFCTDGNDVALNITLMIKKEKKNYWIDFLNSQE